MPRRTFHFYPPRKFSREKAYCEADTRNGVVLTRQVSESDCHYGRTWGYDSNGIWVDGGCRAEFQLRR